MFGVSSRLEFPEIPTSEILSAKCLANSVFKHSVYIECGNGEYSVDGSLQWWRVLSGEQFLMVSSTQW